MLNVPAQIARLDWRKDKVIIILESNENAIFSHELEQHFEAKMDKGLITKCILINPQREGITLPSYKSIDAFIPAFRGHPIDKSIICILGNDEEQIDQLSMYLEHSAATKLVIDLDAIGDNLEYYKGKTNPVNKVMAMVKANTYGHGLVEVAQYLKDKVDYFGVAYVGEGIALRDENIHTPIMVMNPSIHDLQLCLAYELEPEIHSLLSLKHLIKLTNNQKEHIAIQVEIDTGMNRLGIDPEEVDEFIVLLKDSKFIHINGLYSHLACAEDPAEDEFSRKQLHSFNLIAKKTESELGINTIKHIRNSAAHCAIPIPQQI